MQGLVRTGRGFLFPDDRNLRAIVVSTWRDPLAARDFRDLKEIKIDNTSWREVVRRQEAAVALCREVDVMFVLGGLHSANTQELARLCREQGVDTCHLETWDQFEPRMVAGRQIAGVTAGTSTPEWVISEFVQKLEALEP